MFVPSSSRLRPRFGCLLALCALMIFSTPCHATERKVGSTRRALRISMEGKDIFASWLPKRHLPVIRDLIQVTGALSRGSILRKQDGCSSRDYASFVQSVIRGGGDKTEAEHDGTSPSSSATNAIRGGSRLVCDQKQKKRQSSVSKPRKKISKGANKRKQKQSPQRIGHDDKTATPSPSAPSAPSSSASADRGVEIEAVLLPRNTFPPIRVLRAIAIYFASRFLMQCLRTVGEPHRRALAELAPRLLTVAVAAAENDGGATMVDTNHGNTSGANNKSPPSLSSLSPASKESLVRHVAVLHKEMLPSASLPSYASILGLILSIGGYLVATILIPAWSTRACAYMNYHVMGVREGGGVDRCVVDIEGLLREVGGERDALEAGSEEGWSKAADVAVLVRLPEEERLVSGGGGEGGARGQSNDDSSVVIRRLRRCDDSGVVPGLDRVDQVDRSHSHPQPWYFELNQRRIYVNPSTWRCEDGGPTFFRSASVDELVHGRDHSTGTVLGLTSAVALRDATERYGPYNSIRIPRPTVTEAFLRRLSSPLSVLQIVGCFLTAVEEPLFQSAAGIAMTLYWHLRGAQKSTASARALAREVEEGLGGGSGGNGDEGGALGRRVYVLRPNASTENTTSVSSRQSYIKVRTQCETTGNGKATKRKKKKKVVSSPKAHGRDRRPTTTLGWAEVAARDILPGDVFCLPGNDANPWPTVASSASAALPIVAPVDAILLEGSCVCNEAVLTGESVPQCKVPITFDEDKNTEGQMGCDPSSSARLLPSSEIFDLHGRHRSSVLFAGTTVLHVANVESGNIDKDENEAVGDGADAHKGKILNSSNHSFTAVRGDEADVELSMSEAPISTPHGSARFLALRTGSYSSRGEIVRTLVKGRAGVVSNTDSEQDSLRLVAFLSSFAVAACLSLIVDVGGSSAAPKPTTFRRIVQCTRILMASIPTEMPSLLSSVATECSDELRRSSGNTVICSAAPGSLIGASRVDVAVFDKTGTITADTQRMRKVVSFLDDGSSNGHCGVSRGATAFVSHPYPRKRNKRRVNDGDKHRHPMLGAVLAGCHSVVGIASGQTPSATRVAGQSGESPEEGSFSLVGDTLDLAALKFSGWTYDYNEGMATSPSPGSTLKLTDDASSAKDNNKTKTALPEATGTELNTIAHPVALWQLRTFPFDPTRRMSSAILLVLHSDKKYRVWKVQKGAPDVMKDVFFHGLNGSTDNDGSSSGTDQKDFKSMFDDGGHVDDEAFRAWYDNAYRELGNEGMRVLATAVEDVTSQYATDLFPRGMPPSSAHLTKREVVAQKHLIADARQLARLVLRRKYVENTSLFSARTTFAGFACFDASVRQSSARVVRDLKRAGIHVLMLTGDGVDSAISIALETDVIERKQAKKGLVVLEVDSSRGEDRLCWTVTKPLSCRREKPSSGKENTTKLNFTHRSVGRILEKKRGAIVASGEALNLLLSTCKREESVGVTGSACQLLRDRLKDVAVVARASPQTKQRVTASLRNHGKANVLMCGDGVNDVAAMQSANVGVALLNGYGSEDFGVARGADVEDQRRRELLRRSALGKRHNGRETSSSVDKALEDAGVGNSLLALRSRLLQGMRKSTAAKGDISTAIVGSITEEIRRTKALNRGGGSAARILAKEDGLRRSIIKKATAGDLVTAADSDDVMVAQVKPGEACLSADFTLLRPSIDGVEAMLRAGVSAAAFSLATHQTVALESLMSCHGLTLLYGDGVRYGKYMWNVEMFFLRQIFTACEAASRTSRPRLVHLRVRPPKSVFHPSSGVSILLQAIIHVATMTVGVRQARELDLTQTPAESASTGFNIRRVNGPATVYDQVCLLLLDGFCTNKKQGSGSGGSNGGRPPFRPNHITNAVFLLSVYQNAVLQLINHKGRPFYRGVLECRELCVAFLGSAIFVIACVMETIPYANTSLQIAPLRGRRAKVSMLFLLGLNLLACYVVNQMCVFLWHRALWDETWKNRWGVESLNVSSPLTETTAVEEEERLIRMEVVGNRKMVVLSALLMVKLIFDGLLKDGR